MTKENAKKACPCEELKAADAKVDEIKDDELGAVSGGVRFADPDRKKKKDSSSSEN